MDIIRYGNDINVTWSVYGRNGAKYSLTGKIYRLWLVSGPRKKEITSYSLQQRNQIIFVIDDEEINRYGTYKLVLQLREPDNDTQDATYELTHVFQIVSDSYPMRANTVVGGKCDILVKSILKNVYISDLEGASAYEIAVRNGFEGTEVEWLASLVGIKTLIQTITSTESGGLNRWTATLYDGTNVNFDVRNGIQGAAGASLLSQLSDVSISSLTPGNILRYNGSQWVNGEPTDYSYGDGITITQGRVIKANIEEIAEGLIEGGYFSPDGGGSGGGGASNLASLTDVAIGVPVDGQVLTFDGTTSKWKPQTPSSGGGGGGGGDTPTPDLSNYVTKTQPETISGAKTFSSPITLTGTNKRIYFGDTSKYLELNANGFYFYGAGVYTDYFMAAGGVGSSSGGGGGGATNLNGLDDVTISSPNGGQILKYVYNPQTSSGQWVNGAMGLEDLNIDLTGLDNGYTLVYDASATPPKWKVALAGGGTGTTVSLTDIDTTNNKALLTVGSTTPQWISLYSATSWNKKNVTLDINNTDHTGTLVVGDKTATVLLSGYVPSGGGGSSYTLPSATATTLGGVKVFYVSTSDLSTIVGTAETQGPAIGQYRNYPIERSSDGKLFVNVPWVSGSAPVSSVVGQTGAITATQIASALSSYFVAPSALNSYLPLAGGTMTGTITAQDIIPKSSSYTLGTTSSPWSKVYLGSNVYLDYDQNNGCVRVHNAGLVADSYISAGGLSESMFSFSLLSDFDKTVTPQDGYILKYNGTTHKWVPSAPASGSNS